MAEQRKARPADTRGESANIFEVAGVELDADSEPVLVFRTGSLWLGVPAGSVVQLHAPTPPTPMPQAPVHVPGIVNLRGDVVPLLDLARFLDVATPDDAEVGDGARAFERIAVVTAADMRVGLICNEVRGIMHVPRAKQEKIRVARGRKLGRFGTAEVSSDDGVVVLLDLPKLLEEARVKM